MNKQGFKSDNLYNISQYIWLWALTGKIKLCAWYIPRKENVLVGRLSINLSYRQNGCWALVFSRKSIRHFHQILTLCYHKKIPQMEKYISWQVDPQAISSDIFCLTRENLKPSIHPFNLISKVLYKLALNQTLKCILISPLWPSLLKILKLLIPFGKT